MKRNVIRTLVISFSGFALSAFVFTAAKAVAPVSSVEKPIAGITVSLDNYYNASLSTEGLKDGKTTTLSTFVTKEEKEADEAFRAEYENIGIAKVDKYLNIRKDPNTKGEVVGKLPKNGGCYIYSIDENGWAKVKSGKVSGYVDTQYLIVGDEVPNLAMKVGNQIATVNEVTVRIREEANTDCTTLMLVPWGEELHVEDDSNPEWVYVSIDDDKGYVSREYVDIKWSLQKAVAYTDGAVVTSGNSSLRQRMVAYAKQFLGNRYRYGGTSLNGGIDCSGFTMRIYQKFGYNISRTSRTQSNVGTNIKVSSVRPGDLLFYKKGGVINHVAMYIGNGQVIHASNPRSGIKISNMSYRTPSKAQRIIRD